MDQRSHPLFLICEILRQARSKEASLAITHFGTDHDGPVLKNPHQPATMGNVLRFMGRSTGKAISSSPAPSLSLRFAASAGNPFANTVSECKANDQSDYDFHGSARGCVCIPDNPFEASIMNPGPPDSPLSLSRTVRLFI
jgi:hypothetical protein